MSTLDNISNFPAPNTQAMREHLEHLFVGYPEYEDGLIELAWSDEYGAINQCCYFAIDQIEGLITKANALNLGLNCNVFIGAALRLPGTHGRGENADFYCLTCPYIDLDDEGAVKTVKAKYGDARPTMAVITGRKPYDRAHLWWKLQTPIDDPVEAAQLLKGMAVALGGDPNVFNPGRVMRLAGSVAWPIKNNRIREQTLIARRNDGFFYTQDQLEALFPPISLAPDPNAFPADVLIHREISALGTYGKVTDGRNLHMLKTVAAVFSELVWLRNGELPTANKLFEKAGQQYFDSIDMERKSVNTDPKTLWRMCLRTIPRFKAGQISSMPDIASIMSRQEEKNKEWNGGTKIATGSIKVRSAFPIDKTAIPVRDWAVSGLFLKRNVTMLVAPPGSGKSLLALQWAIMEGAALTWGGWMPRKREKVLVINIEDDFVEQQRRLVIAAEIMKVNQDDLIDWVILAEEPESIVVARYDARTRTVVGTPLVEALVQLITELGIGIVIVDPFAETFEGDESNNSEVKWAGMIWREVARRTGAAVVLIHHTRKYAGEMAGNADASRGGGSMIGIARVLVTLFDMTEAEAKAMDIPVEERGNYVRFDDAKANHNKKGLVRWFEKQSVSLGNGNGFLPADDVGVLVPWSPPSAVEGIPMRDIGLVLDAIEKGVLSNAGHYTGQFYGPTVQSRGRWVGNVLVRMLDIAEERAKVIVEKWIVSGTLKVFPYDDPVLRKSREGVRVVPGKRPDNNPEVFTL
jgi:AAA domain